MTVFTMPNDPLTKINPSCLLNEYTWDVTTWVHKSSSSEYRTIFISPIFLLSKTFIYSSFSVSLFSIFIHFSFRLLSHIGFSSFNVYRISLSSSVLKDVLWCHDFETRCRYLYRCFLIIQFQFLFFRFIKGKQLKWQYRKCKFFKIIQTERGSHQLLSFAKFTLDICELFQL